MTDKPTYHASQNPDQKLQKNQLFPDKYSGGLGDAGAAISAGGKHVADWLIGQVRDNTQTEEKIHGI